MLYSAFASITILLALVAIYFGLRLIGRTGWIMAWLRGTAGLALLGIAVMFALVALDLFSYKQVLQNKVLGTVSFVSLGEQHYQASLVLIQDGSEQTFELRGDQWQIDARVISWSGFFKMLGAKPGYRLDRLSGRYYSLEDEHRKPRTVHQLDDTSYPVDFWTLAQKTGNNVPLIDAIYGSATYLPMADGALFEVSLSASGLVATPMNEVAKNSVSRWN